VEGFLGGGYKLVRVCPGLSGLILVKQVFRSSVLVGAFCMVFSCPGLSGLAVYFN